MPDFINCSPNFGDINNGPMLIKLIHSSVNQKEENITASVFTQPLTNHLDHIYDLYFKYIVFRHFLPRIIDSRQI